MANETVYRKELKGKILKSAMEQFLSHGIKKIKMDDIAKTLGISKRTLYETYQDKEQLLYACVSATEEHIDNYVRDYASKGNHNAVEIILEFYHIQIDIFSHISPQFFLDIPKYKSVVNMLEERRRNRDQGVREFFRWGTENGYFRPEINFEVVLHSVQYTMKHIIESHLYDDFSFQTIFENIFLIFIRGMCTEKGIRVVDSKLKKRD